MVQREVVERIVAAALPDATATGVETASSGNSKRTAFVALADGRRVVVQYQSHDRGSLAPEAHLTREIGRRTDAPVPAVLASGEGPEWSYLVAERVDGRDLHETFENLPLTHRRAIARDLGGALAAVHDAFSFGGYGPLGLRDGELAADPGSDWPAVFRRYVRSGLDRFAGPLSRYCSAVERALAAHVDVLPARPTPRLFPWDFRPGNAIVDGADPPALTAVLDWGDPLAADRAFSLAKSEYLVADWYADADAGAERLREAFHGGYATRLSLPERPPACAALYRLGGIVRSAFDARGRVTRPRFPMVDEAAAVAFHRRHLDDALDRLGVDTPRR